MSPRARAEGRAGHLIPAFASTDAEPAGDKLSQAHNNDRGLIRAKVGEHIVGGTVLRSREVRTDSARGA